MEEQFAAAREAHINAREALVAARRRSWEAGALAYQSLEHAEAAKAAHREVEAARAAEAEAYVRVQTLRAKMRAA